MAKAAGLNLEKRGRGFRLVESATGTQVADDWQGENGPGVVEIDPVDKGLRLPQLVGINRGQTGDIRREVTVEVGQPLVAIGCKRSEVPARAE